MELRRLASDWGVTEEQLALVLKHESRNMQTHVAPPSGGRCVELRKVVERFDVMTGEVHTFVHMPGFGKPCKVNSTTTYMGDGWMFRSHIVDNILNQWSTAHLFTLTEKEYPSYE